MTTLSKVLELNTWMNTEPPTGSSDRQIPSTSARTSEDKSSGCFSDLKGWIQLLPDEYKDVTFDSLTELRPIIIQTGKTWAEESLSKVCTFVGVGDKVKLALRLLQFVTLRD